MRLLLKEIIWEITTRCENGCSYCGSKEGWSGKVNLKNIRAIADALAEYPPKEVNISGGDPLLVDLETHKYVVETLKAKGVLCKILINPKSHVLDPTEKLDLYDHVGVSINTQEELNLFSESQRLLGKKNYTVISNFNIYNFFLAKAIAKEIPNGTIWQIQFTMYKDPKAEAALWNHPVALKQLNEDLGTIKHLVIVVADNGNKGECAAGINSMGVLDNGDVVPCLSYRSWVDDITKETVGNLLTTSLRELWTTRFQSQRFGETKCCKDMCSKKLIEPTKPNVSPMLDLFPSNLFPPTPSQAIQLYAVLAYGVTTNNSILQELIGRSSDAD